jgi:CDP-diacylglycerol--serine O-phosphatidyltransferase
MRFDLKKTLFILPNLLTLSSIACGFGSILVCTTADASGQTRPEDFYGAALLIVFAMFFDTIDGRVARLTKTQSAFGVQLDSLADVVSFGVAPALLAYRWSLHTLGFAGLVVAFVYLACGAIRLARFNVLASAPGGGAPKKPGKYILGLPIPGAAGLVVSLVVANVAVTGSLQTAPELIAAIVLMLSFLMVSTIRFRSFKDVRLSWRSVLFFGSVVGSSAVIAAVLHPAFVLAWLILGYVAIALLEAMLAISKKAARVVGGRRGEPETVTMDERRSRMS